VWSMVGECARLCMCVHVCVYVCMCESNFSLLSSKVKYMANEMEMEEC